MLVVAGGATPGKKRKVLLSTVLCSTSVLHSTLFHEAPDVFHRRGFSFRSVDNRTPVELAGYPERTVS